MAPVIMPLLIKADSMYDDICKRRRNSSGIACPVPLSGNDLHCLKRCIVLKRLLILRKLALAVAITPLIYLLGIQPATGEDDLQLTFGVYTTDKPTVLVETFRPILSAIETDLAAKLNKPVSIRLNIERSYERGVAAIVNGEVDFSRLGPASYIDATNKNPALEIIALDSKNDLLTSKGIICVREDSVYKDVSELKGARFAFGNKASTIGRYLSQAYLLQHGIAASDLTNFNYLGRHDRVGYAVAQGTYDAGALKESTFKKLKKNGLPLRELASFENVNKPWIARAGMDGSLVEALREVMLVLSAPEAFDALGKKQFVRGSDDDFKEIRQAINGNEAFFSAAKINAAEIDSQ